MLPSSCCGSQVYTFLESQSQMFIFYCFFSLDQKIVPMMQMYMHVPDTHEHPQTHNGWYLYLFKKRKRERKSGAMQIFWQSYITQSPRWSTVLVRPLPLSSILFQRAPWWVHSASKIQMSVEMISINYLSLFYLH